MYFPNTAYILKEEMSTENGFTYKGPDQTGCYNQPRNGLRLLHKGTSCQALRHRGLGPIQSREGLDQKGSNFLVDLSCWSGLGPLLRCLNGRKNNPGVFPAMEVSFIMWLAASTHETIWGQSVRILPTTHSLITSVWTAAGTVLHVWSDHHLTVTVWAYARSFPTPNHLGP